MTAGIAAIAVIALCKGCKLSGKLLRVALFVILFALHIFASLCISALFATSGHESWVSNYCPEYYIVSDRDNTVKLLFEEGSYLFDGRTNVYCLDNDMRAYEIGSFSTDDVAVMNGNYDVIRTGNKISFEYNCGTFDKNGDPVMRTAEMELPVFS